MARAFFPCSHQPWNGRNILTRRSGLADPSPDGSPDPWEAAYLRFETPEAEIQKFTRRLERLQAAAWPRDAAIVELFCGRGNGLIALERLGFRNVEGADLSARLLGRYRGKAAVFAADSRALPLAEASKDFLIVQGGLHHLPTLPSDLDETLAEMRRVLRKNGRLVIVEPWATPFLKFAHAMSRNRLARRLSKKLDALATMIEHERDTYERWLGQPELICQRVRAHFDVIQQSFAWGKWSFLGKPL
jgi:ubiquinone/menaquinone biosynthesis C-methylase UbiE